MSCQRELVTTDASRAPARRGGLRILLATLAALLLVTVPATASASIPAPATPVAPAAVTAVPTPGSSDRGARRIVTGSADEVYYTADHYASFVVVDVSR